MNICTLPLTNGTFWSFKKLDDAIVLPPGKYYIGDLCYPLDESDLYINVWSKSNHIAPSFYHSDVGSIIMNYTEYDNGTYMDSAHNTYSVCNGNITMISMEIIEEELLKENLSSCMKASINDFVEGGHIHTFTHPIMLRFENNLFQICTLYEHVVLEIRIGPPDEDVFEDDQLSIGDQTIEDKEVEEILLNFPDDESIIEYECASEYESEYETTNEFKTICAWICCDE